MNERSNGAGFSAEELRKTPFRLVKRKNLFTFAVQNYNIFFNWPLPKA